MMFMITMTASYQGEKHVQIVHGPSRAVIETDAPKDNNGRGESFSPTDLVAAALASCAMTVMAIRAEKMGLEIGSMKSVVSKTMIENPRRIARLDLTIEIESLDRRSKQSISSESKKALEEAAYTCPVKQSLSKEMNIDFQIRWI